LENTGDQQVEDTPFSIMDEDIFFERLSREQHKLYSVAYSYMRNEADALEIVQEVACRAWMKRKKLKNEQAFTPWLIRITTNCCMDELRRQKRVSPTDTIHVEATQEMKHNDQIDLERAFVKLKPKHRHVVMLKYYQDMTTAQIAQVLQRPEGTIKSWLREGLKQLRKYL